MSEKNKQVFRKMNMDNDVRILQPGDYRFLRNGINIQGTSVDGLENAITSIYGNALVSNSDLQSSSTIIGFVEDRVNNRAFFAVYHASNPTIYMVTLAGVVSIVMRNSLLAFNSTDFVDMDILGDILVFTNNVGEIKKLDVTKAAAGDYGTVSKEKITLIKRPPQLPVTWALAYDTTAKFNNLAGNYFQFYWRYIYENYDYSRFSPASKVTNSFVHPSTTNCKLATSGNITLSGSQLIDGYNTVANDRVAVVAQTTAMENGIYLAKAGAWVRASDFDTGNSVDIVVYVTNGIRYNFNTVWRFYSTNVGTIAATVERLEGPNYATITRPETPPTTVLGIEYAVRTNGTNELVVYKRESPASLFTSSHTFYNNTYLFTVPDSESTAWNDNVPIKSKSLKIFRNRVFLFNNTEGYTHSTTTQVALSTTEVSPPVADVSSQAASRTYNTAKRGSSYRVGVVFFDYARRHSGVKLINTIKIPYTGSSTNRFRIHAVLDGSNSADVPSWATHYSIVMTKNTDVSYFLHAVTTDVFHYKADSAGDLTYAKSLASFDADGTVIDISSLTKAGIGYTFQAGDRIRLFGSAFANGAPVVDVLILGQEGRFLKTRVLTELIIETTATTSSFFEIYTPKLSAEPFYETGLTYAIGSFTSTAVDLEGDVEVINRLYYYDSSGYSSTNPFANDYILSGADHPDEAMNAWDKNFDKWATISGRSLVEGASLEIQKKNYIRFSQPYPQNSALFNLNTFNALDEYALPAENGPGTQLAEAGEILVGLHETESTAIYIGQGFVNTTSGNDFLAKTDSVVGDDRRYLGGHGTTHQASVVAREGKVYFYNSKKGCIVRRSQDGLTVISDYGIKGIVSYIATLHNADPNNSRIVAGWDPQYDCYCISFFLTGGSYNFTLYFHEKTNSWVCASDLMPYRFGTLGQYQVAFTSTAALYKQTPEANYNNFLGTQYNRSLEWEIAPLESLMKILEGIEIDQTSLYTTAGTNEELVSVYLIKGGTKQTMINYADFRQREGVWRSAFFNIITDVNFATSAASKYKSPYKVRGQSFYMTLAYNGTDKNVLKSITTYFRPKMLSST